MKLNKNLLSYYWYLLKKEIRTGASFKIILMGSIFAIIIYLHSVYYHWNDNRHFNKNNLSLYHELQFQIKLSNHHLPAKIGPVSCDSPNIGIGNGAGNGSALIGQIKNEITQMESKFPFKSIVTGEILGIDLQKIPYPMTEILANYQEAYLQNDVKNNYQNCPNIICILNDYFKDPSEESSYLTYYIYLKTGAFPMLGSKLPWEVALQLQELSPSFSEENKLQKNAQIDNAAHLWKKKELLDLYELIKDYPSLFWHGPNLTSFYKVDENLWPEKADPCSIYLISGEMVFNNSCFNSYNKHHQLKNSFYASMLKAYDYQSGLRWGKEGNYSGSKEYIESLNYLLTDHINPSTNKYELHWRKINRMGKIKNHQDLSNLTHPSFELYEILKSYFNPKSNILQNQNLQRDLASDHAQNVDAGAQVLTNIYLPKADHNQQDNNLKTIDENSLSKLDKILLSYQEISDEDKVKWKINKDEWDSKEISLMSRCLSLLKNVGSENESISFSHQSYSKLSESLFNECFQKEAKNYLKNVSNNYQAQQNKCTPPTDHKNLVEKNQNLKLLEEYLTERFYFAKIEYKQFKNNLVYGAEIKQKFFNNLDPKTFYLKCYDELKPRDCFYQNLKNHLNNLVNNANDIDVYYKNFIYETLIGQLSYEQNRWESEESIKYIIKPFLQKNNQVIAGHYENCKASSKDELSEEELQELKFYRGSEFFIKSDILNCLNQEISKYLPLSLNAKIEFKNDNEVKSHHLTIMEKKIIKPYLLFQIKKELNRLVHIDRLKEKENIQNYFTHKENILVEKVIAHPQLLDGIYSLHGLENQCLDKLSQSYPKNISFHHNHNLDQKFGRKICSIVSTDERITKSIQERFSKFRQEQINLVGSTVKKEFNKLVDNCNDTYPLVQGTSYIKNSRLRKICIEESFNESLQWGMEKWKKSELHAQFASDDHYFEAQINAERDELITKALK